MFPRRKRSMARETWPRDVQNGNKKVIIWNWEVDQVYYVITMMKLLGTWHFEADIEALPESAYRCCVVFKK